MGAGAARRGARAAGGAAGGGTRRGDGVGLIQEAATQGELIGLSERADVLLFALA